MSQFNLWSPLLAGTQLDRRTARRRTARRRTCLVVATALLGSLTSVFVPSSFADESEFAGLIRSKTSDKGSYQPPITLRKKLPTEAELSKLETVKFQEYPDSVADILTAPNEPEFAEPEFTEPEFAEPEFEQPTIVRARTRRIGSPSASKRSAIAQAAYGNEVMYEDYGDSNFATEGTCAGEPTCGFEPACGCEAAGYECDGSCMTCDSGSCSTCGGCGACDMCGYSDCLPRLSLDPCQWFGSVELMMMWRVGDGLPVLATTSTVAYNTGVIGPGTTTLFGGERVLDQLTAGGRVTIGTWLDDQQCRSLVFRGWGAEPATFHFATDETRNALIARPFFNVTDGQAAAQGSQVIAAATQRNGSINIDGKNSVYGGDVSLRQRCLGGLGGFIDVLYGYQYMRMDDSLRIGTSSTVLANQALPQGSIINVVDRFDAENEFHGGQLGLAARYRERCWSFNGSIKAAAGGLRRSVQRDGVTNTSTGGVNATVPTGLLVRSLNTGKVTDNTFAWIPELDATIGWRWTRNLDLTFGYHAIVMTNALQVSGAIDRDLAVNAADNPTGQQRPNAVLQYDTYYIHGIHFGLQCVY